jgi:trimeric autotransporter adhesin
MSSSTPFRFPALNQRALLCAFLFASMPVAPAQAAADDDSHYNPRFGLGTLEGATGIANGVASALAVDSQYVYYGGSFAKVSGYRVNNIVRYNKKTGGFERLGGPNACGTNGTVWVIKPLPGGLVHVGGTFTHAGVDTAGKGGTETGPYAYFDGKDWKPVGPKLTSTGPASVYHIEFNGLETYIGGAFSMAGADTIRNIARYKGGDKMEPLWDPGQLANGVAGSYNTFVGYKFAGMRVSNAWVTVGGNFSVAGGRNVSRVARWNIGLEEWDAMKGGLSQAPAMAVNDMDMDGSGKVYFAYKNVHIMEDTGWTVMPGTEVTGSVTRFVWNTPFGSMMYGNGGAPFDSGAISFWNGNEWKGPNLSRLGYIASSDIRFAADDKRIWIGSGSGLKGATGMSWYDGKQFGVLGNGLRVTRDGGLGINDFAELDGKIIVAGSFSHLGSAAVEGVARWTGESWEALGEGYQSVYRLAVYKGKLYAAGSLNKKDKPVEGGLAVWTGAAWEIVPGFEKRSIEALAATETHLWMAGGLGTGNGELGRWDGTTLESFGKELTSSAQIGINSIVPWKEGRVCVSGHFNKVNGLPAGGAACFEPVSGTWTGMGAALPAGSSATSLKSVGDDLYLGCYCTFASGAKNIGKWDGKEWAAVGSGLDKGVQRILANGSDLYAVGVFAKAGDLAVNGVARWDGKDWTALGSGVSPANAGALFVGAGGLWLGGSFTTAGGIPSRNIALYGNVEKKAEVPMGLVPGKGPKASRRSPVMRPVPGGMEFGQDGKPSRADGRHLRKPGRAGEL